MDQLNGNRDEPFDGKMSHAPDESLIESTKEVSTESLRSHSFLQNYFR